MGSLSWYDDKTTKVQNDKRISIIRLCDRCLSTMRVFGLNPYDDQRPLAGFAHRGIWFICSILLTVYVAFFLVFDVAFFRAANADSLSRLDFLKIVAWLGRFFFIGNGVTTIPAMLFVTRRLPNLLQLFQIQFGEIIVYNAMRKWTRLVRIWYIAGIAGMMTCLCLIIPVNVQRYYTHFPRTVNYGYWNYSHFGIVRTDMLTSNFIYLTGVLISGSGEMLSQFLFILILLAVFSKYKELSDSVRTLFTTSKKNSQISLRIRNLSKQHWKLQDFTDKINCLFSLMNVMWLMREITGGLALCALVLQRDDDPESLAHIDKSTRVATDVVNYGSMPTLLAITLSGLVNAGIRFCVCICLTTQAKEISSELQNRILTKNVFCVDDVHFECQDFLERLTNDPVEISPFGCFIITREFAISVIGVLMAHFLIIYQMEDQKVDMDYLLSYKDAVKMAQKLEALVKNFTVIAVQKQFTNTAL